MRKLIIFIFFSLIFSFIETKTERVICYYGSWSYYRNGNGKFLAEDIDGNLCTHVIYTFLGVNNDGTLRIADSWLELDLKNLNRFVSLKMKNPKLKTLAAVGGWNEGSVKFSQVASSQSKRRNFVQNSIDFLKTYNFDGLDLDWEYPSQRGGSSNDKINYVSLIKELREEFNKHNYLLTAAVSAANIDLSYNVTALSTYLDSINVMAYDLHGSYDGVTGANAPLYPSSVDRSESAKRLTVDASIRDWLSKGADPRKISMGMPLYGRTYTLSNPNQNGVGAPVSNSGNPGPYTQESGMLGYLEICEKHKEGGWKIVWDENTKTPYTYKGNQWIGYDNEKSIKAKVDYAKSLNLGGVMLWSVETADHKGICGDKYPILTTIKKMLNDDSTDVTYDTTTEVPYDMTTEDTSSSSEIPNDSTEDSNNSTEDSDESDEDSDESVLQSLCKDSTLVRDPKDCATFYFCIPLLRGTGYQLIKTKCSNNLVFDDNAKVCNYKGLVKC